MLRTILIALFLLPGSMAWSNSCSLSFVIEITQGVGTIRPGAMLSGSANFTTAESYRQEGGSTAHIATGNMSLGTTITGPIWTIITTRRTFAADLVALYARDVTGFDFAGVAFEGPMALTLYGYPGTRLTEAPPQTQIEWDSLTLRRSFQLHASGRDMLAGDITELTANCI
jgi:hypothetical protein